MSPAASVILATVFWCSASAPFDTFDPHRPGAVQRFVAANPETCQADAPREVTQRTVAECKRDAALIMTDWLSRGTSAGKVYLYAECSEAKRERLDLEAMKRRVAE